MSNTYSIENELKLIISTTFGLILNDTIRNEERSLLPNVPTMRLFWVCFWEAKRNNTSKLTPQYRYHSLTCNIKIRMLHGVQRWVERGGAGKKKSKLLRITLLISVYFFLSRRFTSGATYYRPQTKLRQWVMFSETSVCPRGGIGNIKCIMGQVTW